MTQTPAQPPEGALIESARERRVPRLSIREIAKLAGISEARWRQIEKGYSTPRKDFHVPVTAPADTLGRMAHAAIVDPKELREVGRQDAANWLDEMLGASADSPPVEITRVEADGFEAFQAAVEGTPPELQALALRLAIKAVEAVREEAGSSKE